MKIAVLLICLLFIGLAGCPATAHPTFPPPETYTPPPTTNAPETTPPPVEVPLSYEIVDSYVKEDTVTHKSSIDIGGIGSAEDTWEEIISVACVKVKNTDSVSGIFTVTFQIDEPLDSIFLARELELAPDEALTAECPAYALGDWSFEVIPSTKLVKE